MSVTVPNVTGDTVTQAKAELGEHTLEPDWRDKDGNPIPDPPGSASVTGQDPTAGTTVPSGATVRCTVE